MTLRLDLRLTWYELRLYVRSGVLAALLVGALTPWVFWLPDDPARRVQAALAMCETFAVASAPLLFGGLISREFEERTADILFSRPQPREDLILRRMAVGMIALAALVALPALGYGLRGVALPVSDMLTVVFPGALALAAASLAVGALTRSTAAAFLAPAAYWFFDWGTRGVHTGYVTLFARSIGRSWWPASKLALIGLAIVLFTLSIAAARRRA